MSRKITLTCVQYRQAIEPCLGGAPSSLWSGKYSRLHLPVQFVCVDIDDAASLEAALNAVDLVVHAAGPFQRKDTCGVLEAAIATKTPYMDVCDDTEHSQRLRAYSDQAKAAGVPCITTAGDSEHTDLCWRSFSHGAPAPLMRFFTLLAGSLLGAYVIHS